MTKDDMLNILKGLFKTDEDVSYLLKIEKVGMEELVSVVSDTFGG